MVKTRQIAPGNGCFYENENTHTKKAHAIHMYFYYAGKAIYPLSNIFKASLSPYASICLRNSSLSVAVIFSVPFEP